ncbi:MAG: GNAT family N-acetyltransferase [Firmicutes bacterium]|nr:GNAT family N-acetyltransferase [Bacillota bacterium]
MRLTIKETEKEDLGNLRALWNDGEVMFFVGFPQGLGITREETEQWLEGAIAKPQRCHYSIYADQIGFCGEAFYNVDDHGLAALDIKLLPKARGKGIAFRALTFAINQAFASGLAERAYVEPHPGNEKARQLYKRLGFKAKPRPDYLEEGQTYLELSKSQWKA